MIPISILPTINAVLNSTSALFLVVGYLCIRNKKVLAHKLCMLAAFATSTLFLISYLIYHFHVGSVAFQGKGWIRILYFSVLLSHTVLAAAIVPMVGVTLWRAFQGNFERHKRIARRTFPIWVYVSVTGVAVYWMLYRLF